MLYAAEKDKEKGQPNTFCPSVKSAKKPEVLKPSFLLHDSSQDGGPDHVSWPNLRGVCCGTKIHRDG